MTSVVAELTSEACTPSAVVGLISGLVIAEGGLEADAFRPNLARARALAAHIRRRLAASFAHVFDAALPHLALDPAPVREALARLAAATRVPPAIFILHRRCVRAAVQGDLAGLHEGFERLSRAACQSTPALRVRNWGDASFSPEECEDYRWIFTEDHGDLPIAPLATPPATFARASAALARARVALRDADPALADEIEALIGEIVLAVDAGTGSRFDGATSFFAQGALLLNAAEHVSVPEALSGLVHESAHSWLFAETEGAPLVENDPAQRYASPLRADPRPMNGIYHATIVSARMACALEAALSRHALDPADEAEARRLLATSKTAFESGRDVVRAHAVLIPLARRILDDAEAAMAKLPISAPPRRGRQFTFSNLTGAAALQGHMA